MLRYEHVLSHHFTSAVRCDEYLGGQSHVLGAWAGARPDLRTTPLVEWPLCGAVVELTRNFSVGRGLFNGARCVVSKVGRDALEVHLLGPARKLQGMTSPVTVPRASVTPDGCRFGYPQPQNGCRFGYPRPHTFADKLFLTLANPDLSSLESVF